MKRQRRQEILRQSFALDMAALKPGNVGSHADGHGMSQGDFARSAERVTPILCDVSLSCGARVQAAVAATMEAVGCNTNLGMLLLAAPLLCAVEACPDTKQLRDALRNTLDGLSAQDAEAVFAAIRQASPGGLGKVPEHDVHEPPDCGLLDAMQAAASRDQVALQYVSGFADVFAGAEEIDRFLRQGLDLEWAVAGAYLMFLGGYADTHVQRKYGAERAESLRRTAQETLARFRECAAEDPRQLDRRMRPELLEWDQSLKQAAVNPGSSADLCFASALLHLLGDVV